MDYLTVYDDLIKFDLTHIIKILGLQISNPKIIVIAHIAAKK